jgi:hypothetical protein
MKRKGRPSRFAMALYVRSTVKSLESLMESLTKEDFKNFLH